MTNITQRSKALILSIILMALGITSTSSATPVDDHCRTREQRCEMKCSTNNKVGSDGHLRCNDNCRSDEQFCRREGFTPDRTWWQWHG